MDGFFEDFEEIFDEKLHFLEFKFKLQNFWFSGWILQTMISATKGKSRRPNHMPSHMDALQTLPPVNFRRGARDFHSVAKQASFYVALGSDF